MTTGVLSSHRRRGTKLIPPLADRPIQTLDWEGAMLPEYLWIGLLVLDNPKLTRSAALFNAACDVLDDFFQPPETGQVFLGYLSDFGSVDASRRAEAIARLEREVRGACGTGFRAALALYPSGPAVWLAAGGGANTSFDGTLRLLREVVDMLRDRRSSRAAQCEALSFSRLLKHGKMHFPKHVPDEELTDALCRYPFVNEEEGRRVEQFVRLGINAFFSFRTPSSWPSDFWTANFELQACR